MPADGSTDLWHRDPLLTNVGQQRRSHNGLNRKNAAYVRSAATDPTAPQRLPRPTCHPGDVLRMLRARRDGRPTVRARVVAALIVVGMVALTAPILAAPILTTLHWLVALL